MEEHAQDTVGGSRSSIRVMGKVQDTVGAGDIVYLLSLGRDGVNLLAFLCQV